MVDERLSDEEVVRALPDEILTMFSARQRAALDHVLARLAAAEKVCELVSVNLSPTRRTEARDRKVYWWDVAAAVKEWEGSGRP